METSRSTLRVWQIATILLLAAGLSLLVYALLPYPAARSLVDRLASDGTLESYSPDMHQAVHWVSLLLGCILLAIGIYHLVARESSQRRLASLLEWLTGAACSIPRDARNLWKALLGTLDDPLILSCLLVISLAGIAIRLVFIKQPMRYDEAYTYYAFVAQGVRVITTDYHLPNNHVLHSLLVYLTTTWLGNDLWSLRLPAFIAGVCMIPATYLAGVTLYNRYVGLFAAALVASASTLIEYSTNARGYTLMTLAWLLMLALAAYLKRHPNGVGWALFAILGVAGMYAVPTMLFPLGIVIGWLGLSWLTRDVAATDGRRFLVYLVVACLALAILTLLAYLPIIASSGVGIFTSTRFVQALEEQTFIESLVARLANTWRDWTMNLPPWGSLLLAAGALLSVIFHQRLSPHRIHTALPTVLWCSILLLIQRVAPWPRVWLFLAPLFFIWAAAGIPGLLASYYAGKGRWRMAFPAAAAALAFGLCLLVFVTQSPLRLSDIGDYKAAEKTALFLQSQLQPGDVVVSVLPSNYPLRYYFEKMGIPEDTLYRPRLHRNRLDRVWLVVNLDFSQTLQGVLEKSELQDVLGAEQARLVHTDPGSELYLIDQ